MSTSACRTGRGRRRTRIRLAALLGAGSLVGAVVPAGLTTPSATAADEPACQLVGLRTAGGSPWGTVVDIEVVDGRPTYFGTYDRLGKDGELHGQAVVWRGLDADPLPVGPRGADATIALGLTRTGLVNGWSEKWDTGAMRFWVQDLTTGELRWFRTRLDGRRADGAYIRGVNDEGAAVGQIAPRGEPMPWAVGYRAGSSTPFQLPVPTRADGSSAHGINNLGQRAGFWSHTTPETAPNGIFHATVWDEDGSRHRLASPGFDADAAMINDAGQVAGGTWMGSVEGGHHEGVFWGSYDAPVALGLLPEGGDSSVWGLDEAGRVVGAADHLSDPEDPMTDPYMGTTSHNFLWTPDLGTGRVRVLPSLYSVSEGQTEWTQWYSVHAAHASNAALDQVGAGTHSGFAEDGTPIGTPTVFVNASQCGVVVETSHDAFWDTAGPSADRSRPATDRGVMGESLEGRYR